MATLTTAITSALNMEAVYTALQPCLTVGLPLFIGWFGIRKLIKVATSAVKGGKVRV